MIVTVPPKVEPVTLATIKEQLGISKQEDTNEDRILERRIAVARRYAEKYTGRAFITQTREKRWNTFLAKFKLPSALTVVSFKYIDTDGVEQNVSVSDYELVTFGLVPFVRKAYSATWPNHRNEEQAVRITYTAGYGPKPVDVDPILHEALVEIVGYLTNNQGQNESGILLARMPYAIRDKLDMFRLEWV